MLLLNPQLENYWFKLLLELFLMLSHCVYNTMTS